MLTKLVVQSLLFFLKIIKGDDIMVTVYVTLIIKGYKTYAQVPANLQPAVEVELGQLGLGTDGKPLDVTA
ncbi:CD1375 family protein [Schinkia azotoformans]|uniref:CD1375 family protein n=1 Tax=Schinkia azotoformans TaxID=1454 RepID=UPI002DB7C708|nr:CD1375 family protein [Schinkia azotoformans]MEC1716587.1 CD1375 family protein [Schinkia azotoformans]MEC1739425.1 CD1375 family protein [Schinkia azotoformans]MEC1745505.1 CD1375 family protein [Schinkia azotoformans]MEC1756568.1 CD1375 family protein [Schinkia azotoformans]MEC1765835.1 CD1375 family protein [Schinkia azotoformans]